MSAEAWGAIVASGIAAIVVIASLFARHHGTKLAKNWVNSATVPIGCSLDGVGRSEQASGYLFVAGLAIGLLALTFAVPIWLSGDVATTVVGVVTFVLGVLVTVLGGRLKGATPISNVLWRVQCTKESDCPFCTEIRNSAHDLSSDNEQERGGTAVRLYKLLKGIEQSSPQEPLVAEPKCEVCGAQLQVVTGGGSDVVS
jgi:hypothetical protein